MDDNTIANDVESFEELSRYIAENRDSIASNPIMPHLYGVANADSPNTNPRMQDLFPTSPTDSEISDSMFLDPFTAQAFGNSPNPRPSSSRPVDVPLQPLKTVQDLTTLLKHGSHANGAAGPFQSKVTDKLHSAILFEAVRVDSNSSAVELRYLPLARAASPRRSRWDAMSGPSSLAENAQQTIEVLPRIKRSIEFANSRKLSVSNADQHPRSAIMYNNQVAPASSTTAPLQQPKWPTQVPVEIFNMFAGHLSPRDISSMRLVCKEFEQKISPNLFEEVVVPFTPDLFDMVEDDASARRAQGRNASSKGKGKGRAVDEPAAMLHSSGQCDENGYYHPSSKGTSKRSLRVFQGFGPHMKKFGIRFDVTEAELSAPPSKKSSQKQVEAYHGGYIWPPSGYARYSRLAKLEQVADETPRMAAALASLVNVREIGLSIDSGLGFLSGPDRSCRSMILQKPAPLFKDADTSSRPMSSSAEEFWSCLQDSHTSFTLRRPRIQSSPALLSSEQLLTCALPVDCDKFPRICPPGFGDTSLWPSTQANAILDPRAALPAAGIIYTLGETQGILSPRLSPFNLTNDQNQWLLETGWAQHAFMDSYVLALSDNPQIFHQVKKVTISKISSSLLLKLDNDTFWDALPNVQDLTLLVSPDWRNVSKDEAGYAQTPKQQPSNAIGIFHGMLRHLLYMEHVRELTIGYASGGENATGLFSRNSHLLPAPLTTRNHALDTQPAPCSFPNIKHLVLKNCWLTPCMLVSLAKSRQAANIAENTLTLDSVSLTVNPVGVLKDTFDLQAQNSISRRYRHGSWPVMIQKLRARFQPPQDQPASDSPATLPPPTQQTITFTSCGYATFPNRPPNLTSEHSLYNFDTISLPTEPLTSDWHRIRADHLSTYMMTTTDQYLARVAPYMNTHEKAALVGAGMTFGWPEDRAEEAAFDGLPLGGTGRFSGRIA